MRTPCWHLRWRPGKELTLDLVLCGIDLLQHRNAEGSRFARSVLGPGKDVTARERDGDGLFLDGRGRLRTGTTTTGSELQTEEQHGFVEPHLEALLENPHQQLPLQEVVLELAALRGGDILGGKEIMA